MIIIGCPPLNTLSVCCWSFPRRTPLKETACLTEQIKEDWKYSSIMSWFNTQEKVQNQKSDNKCKSCQCVLAGESNFLKCDIPKHVCAGMCKKKTTTENCSSYFIRTVTQQAQINESHSSLMLGINFTHQYSQSALVVRHNAPACQCGVIN